MHIKHACTVLVMLMALPFLCSAQTIVNGREERANRKWWKSVAVLSAAVALDCVSSYGMVESNPMYASRDGRFKAKGLTLRLGTSSAGMLVQYLIVRKHPEYVDTLAVTNYGIAAGVGGVAVHNLAIR